MEPLQFYSLREKIDSLSDDEFASLLFSLSREFLTTRLFLGLSLKQRHTLNVYVNKILEARFRWMPENTKDVVVSSMTDDRQPIRFEDIPNLPLSKISSFLTLTEQRNFERTNRSIFIQFAVGYFDFGLQLTAEDLEDCDWPRKLKEIDLDSNGQEQSDRAPKTDELESLHLVDHNMIGNLDGKLGKLKNEVRDGLLNDVLGLPAGKIVFPIFSIFSKT